jgi:predicted metal-dependent hydrolase
MTDYNTILSKRKTICIQINSKGVTIKAPVGTPKSVVQDFVSKKQKWIDKKLKEQEEAKNKVNKALPDKSIMFMGKIRKLVDSEVASYLIQDNQILVNNCFDKDDFYKQEMAKYVKDKVAVFKKQMQVEPSRITIKANLVSRWGSCSSKGNINLNMTLIQTPAFVIDHVIIHELAHLKEMNHSKKFWEIVKHFCPDYKQAKIWLKEYRYLLVRG